MAQEISKVSQAFIAKVDAAIEGGVKKAADTKEEYAKLGEMLSGCKNEHETAYIQEKMKEYDIKYKLGDLRSRASEFVQKTVDNIKSRFKPKKALDRDEAKSLVDELRRAVEENRVEDAEYIREELHQAGFDDLMKDFDEQQEKMHGKNAEETPKETDKTQEMNKSTENSKIVEKNEPNTTEPTVSENKKSVTKKKTRKSSQNSGEVPIPPGQTKDEPIDIPAPWKGIAKALKDAARAGSVVNQIKAAAKAGSVVNQIKAAAEAGSVVNQKEKEIEKEP